MSKGLICLDLDGTLLNRESTISQRNKESLLQCLEKGYTVCIVTGRPYCFARYMADLVDPGLGVIACSGACCEQDGELSIRELPKQALLEFIDCLEQFGSQAFFKGLKDFYTHEPYDRRFLYDHWNPRFQEQWKVRSRTELSYDELRRQAAHIQKVLVYEEDLDRVQALGEQAGKIPGLRIDWYSPRIGFDLMGEGVDKGNAIKSLRLRLGLSVDQVLAIGDSYNDISMFREAGCTIAMGNALPHIKSQCRYVTGTNGEDGVAQVLECVENYI